MSHLIHGFELRREQHIPELNTLAQIYHHVQTGAELLSLQNDDENKVFDIVFRTLPVDSTGLPHIMEHAVLGGSRKYPVKEPFVELLKGSLNTFVNAMTSIDKTSYPVASQNVKDFYNLVDVYLDAVFYPRITPYTLMQEGWHYELDRLDGEMAFKGIVFNEMKGAYSSPDNLMYRYSRRALFPDTPYGLDSGGDPAEIPNLTYAQFKHFHETCYHPSNARILFYGDDDPVERLRLVNEYLKDFARIEILSTVPLQAPFDAPQHLEVPFDVGEGDSSGEKKAMLAVNWLLCEGDDPERVLGLNVLEHILIGTPASPLRKALIDSGLGEDLAGGGLNDSVRQIYFGTGLKGMSAENVDRVESLILDTLTALVDKGLDPNMVTASMNTVEFILRENNTGRFPRGIALAFRALSTWLYGGDPLAPLMFDAPLSAIKARLSSGEPYFEGLIAHFLVDNPHRATVLLKPDPNVRQEQEAAEKARLDAARAAMSEADLLEVIEATRELKRIQETPDSPEALATIPVLTLDDLDKENKLIPLEVSQPGSTEILYHDLFTNGIVYLDLAFDLHALPQELLPFVPLFGQSLTKMGTATQDFVKLSQRIGQKTGGIGASPLTSALIDRRGSAARLVVRAKSTVGQTQDMLDILHDVLLTVKLDDAARFKQIVLENKARMEASLVPGGHAVAGTRLGAHFDQAGWLDEQMGGIAYLFFLRQLAERIDNDWSSVLAQLAQVKALLVNRDSALCNVTVDAANWAAIQPRLIALLDTLPAAPVELVTWTPEPLPPFEGLTIPARVNYVAKGANLYELGYQLDGSVAVISNYLRVTWLWERVRVHGGAYGGFCTFDRPSGVFSYLSYRDPNLLGTLDNYDRSADYLRDLDLSQDELIKGIIGAVGRIDAYQLPDAKGFTSLARYLIGESDVDRQRFREQVLSTTVDDFRMFADVLARVNEAGWVVVLGAQEAIEKANAEKGGDWLTVTKVL
ncbi:MAG: insulinase family protein [Anaerolineae bacterium]|nr:insulinase family protein [Anaerolineae bacterium]